MLTAKQMLEAAWKLIEDPNNRCVGNYAVNAQGDWTYWNSPDACRFCTIGALRAAANNDFGDEYQEAFDYLLKAQVELFPWYPTITKASDVNVINNPPRLYARAIELASKEKE